VCKYCGGVSIKLTESKSSKVVYVCENDCAGKHPLFIEIKKSSDNNFCKDLKNTTQETENAWLFIIPSYLGCSKCELLYLNTNILEYIDLCEGNKNIYQHNYSLFNIMTAADMRDCKNILANKSNNQVKNYVPIFFVLLIIK
jgi:hypothetical protein